MKFRLSPSWDSVNNKSSKAIFAGFNPGTADRNRFTHAEAFAGGVKPIA